MSLSGALSNALSGLTANARAAGLVSTNIANANTEGYGRRDVTLASGAVGSTGGVRVLGVTRQADLFLLSDRRVSDAEMGFAGARQAFAQGIETAYGAADDPGSLAARVTAFENALTLAASNPASTQRLEAVSVAARDLAGKLNALSDYTQSTRAVADRSIGNQVTVLNSNLARIEDLNREIVASTSRGEDPSSLFDQRQLLIDDVGKTVPLRVVQRDRGEVALFTTGGGVLLDGSAVEIGFTTTNTIDATRTFAAGDLSGLTVNGIAVNSTATGPFSGGTLGAAFLTRDVDGVARQAELDALTRDLVERFGAGGPDATLGATDPGLFTDAGLAFDPLDEAGLAGRVALNPLVTPGSADIWRLRDGLGAAAPGPVGDSRLLIDIGNQLTTPVVPGSATLPAVARGFVDLVTDLSSSVSGQRVRADAEQSFAAARNTSLKELEYSKGVDTDAELQALMRIEKQYAANAQVINVVDQLMDRLINAF